MLILFVENSTFGLITSWSGGVNILPVIGGSRRSGRIMVRTKWTRVDSSDHSKTHFHRPLLPEISLQLNWT